MPNLPDYVRRPLRLFLWTFLGIFGLALTGWLGDVVEWAGQSGAQFPGLSPLGKAAVAGAAAGVSAVVAFVVNLLEDKTSAPAILKAPASPGQNPEPDAGAGEVRLISCVAAGVLVAWLVILLVRAVTTL